MVSTAAAQEPNARYGEVLSARLAAQQEMSRWLSETLSDVAYPHRVVVAVELVLQGELREIVDKETRPSMDMKLGVKKSVKLPGLPQTDKNVGAPGMSVKMPGASRTIIQHELDTHVRKISLRLFVDEDMPAERIEEIKALAATLGGVEADRGDSVEVVTVSQLPSIHERAAEQGFPTWIPIMACATVFASCLILAMALGRRRGEGATKLIGELTAAAGLGGGRADVTTNVDEVNVDGERPSQTSPTGKPSTPLAFAFLAESADDDIVEVLTRLEPETAAIVLDQLPVSDDVERRLFDELPEDKQLELAAALGTRRVIPTTKLQELEAEVEDALTIVKSRKTVGSHDRLAALLEQAPESSRDRLMAALAKRDPSLGEAVRQRIIVFDDLEKMPRESLRQLVAEVDPTITARALHGAPEALREAVLGAVSRRLRGILTAEAEGIPDEAQGDEAVATARRTMERAMRRINGQKGRASAPS